MDQLLNATLALGVVLLLLVLGSLRQAHMRVEYSVSWLVAAAALIVVSRWRGLLDSAAALLGATYPPMVIMLFAGGVFLLVFFRFTVILSKLKDDNIALAQKLAILEYRLNHPSGPES